MAEPPTDRPHQFVLDRSRNEEFRRRGRGGGKAREVARRDHGQGIRQNADDALAEQDRVREERDFGQLEALGVDIIEAGFPIASGLY